MCTAHTPMLHTDAPGPRGLERKKFWMLFWLPQSQFPSFFRPLANFFFLSLFLSFLKSPGGGGGLKNVSDQRISICLTQRFS